MGLATEALELARQRLNDDTDFYVPDTFFFELRIPAEVSLTGQDVSFFFPIVVPPSSYRLSEPFTIEETPTIGGGLYVEENGIIQRTIRLEGSTGFRPRKIDLRRANGSKSMSPLRKNPATKSHARTLNDLPATADFSGQRHFQYLQDSVFRVYADLKKDPGVSEKVQMMFHIPKDGEHWEVKPRTFELNRDAGKRFLYQYSIELLVVGLAQVEGFDFSADQSVTDAVKDKLKTVRDAIGRLEGSIRDVTAAVNEVGLYLQDFTDTIGKVQGVASAIRDFTDGLSDVVRKPFGFVQATTTQLGESIAAATSILTPIDTLVSSIDTLSLDQLDARLLNKSRQILDDLYIAQMYPELFQESVTSKESALRSQQGVERNSDQRREDAKASNSPETSTDYDELGTELTPGDAIRDENEINPGRGYPKYKSAREITVESGDTLALLAMKYLGDARQWKSIAVLNGLKPPYSSEQANAPLASFLGSTGLELEGIAPGVEGVLGLGKKILIPTNARNPLEGASLPVLGADPNDSAAARFLGTDFELEVVSAETVGDRVEYDIPVNTELGSTDVRAVAGLDNIKQMIATRITTERGTDPMYPRLGLRRVIGLGFSQAELEGIKYAIQETLLEDPRILRIPNITLQQQGDALVVDLDAEIKNFDERVTIRQTL
jgi:phage baseplate assembly protein W